MLFQREKRRRRVCWMQRKKAAQSSYVTPVALCVKWNPPMYVPQVLAHGEACIQNAVEKVPVLRACAFPRHIIIVVVKFHSIFVVDAIG